MFLVFVKFKRIQYHVWDSAVLRTVKKSKSFQKKNKTHKDKKTENNRKHVKIKYFKEEENKILLSLHIQAGLLQQTNSNFTGEMA